MLTLVATTVFGSTILIPFGLAPTPGSVPLFDFVRDHALISFCIGLLLFAITIAAFLLIHRKSGSLVTASPSTYGRLHVPLLAVTTGTSTISTALVVAIIALLVTRPAWCPMVLCPQPPGPHDQNLEADFTAFQSSTFAITGDPAQYSLSHLPDTGSRSAVAAVRIDRPAAADPYRLAIRIHSLQRGRFGMVIEQVGIEVAGISTPPEPLQVWVKGSSLNYTNNPFKLVYQGQPKGSVIAARYAGQIEEGQVQLAPGEADEITIQLSSGLVADLTYRVQIVYRVMNEDQLRTLTLPYLMEAVFSDGLNWHPYELQGGHFVPA